MRGIFSIQRLLNRQFLYKVNQRTFLSNSYYCSDLWKHRLKTPILSQVNVDGDFILQMQRKFDREGAVSAVDIDILANKLEETEQEQLDYIISLFARFRKTRESLKICDSTPYAIVRSLLSLGETELLLEILQDKLKYGIFLDNYMCNILLDHFLKAKQYQEAALIAYDQMLQEDFTNSLTKALSWYACHQHWKTIPTSTATKPEENAEEEAAEQEQSEEEEEEEDNYIKVEFIETPYYDDHFDLPKDTMKLGKTFVALSRGDDSIVGRSYALIGWGLYEKFDKGFELLDDVIKTDGASMAQDTFESFKSILENIETKEPPEKALEPGEITMADVYPYITQQQKEEYIQKLQALESKLQYSKMLVEYNLEEQLLNSVNEQVKQTEPIDIDAQKDLFAKWIEDREQLIAQQVAHYKLQQKKEALAHRILELQRREEKLRFFEEEGKISIAIKEAKEIKPIDDLFKTEA